MEINNLISFYRKHQDYAKDIHMLVTDTDTWELVHLMLVECSGINIHVYCKNATTIKEIKKVLDWEDKLQKSNTLSFDSMEDLMALDQIGVLMFDEKIDHRLVLQLADKKPQALVGLMRGTNVSYLQIWEAYKDSCKYVYLRYLLVNGKTEIFDWTKSENDMMLSVIFPVYNVAKYLDQCIESISAWKAPYVEYLFVNDGSPDNSRDIILKYAKKDPRIKLIDKPNGGCASARQKGLEAAKGRYIGFIDPDDFIDPDMFRQLLGRALLGSYELCYCGYNEYYETTGTIKPMEDALGDPYAWGTINKDEIQRLIIHQRTAIWRGIYARELIDRAQIEFQTNLRRFDDLPFKIEVCAQAKSAVALKQFLYYYRLDRPGQDVSCTDERLYVHFDIFKHLDEICNRLDERKLKDYLQVAKVQTHAYAMKKLQEKFVTEYARQAKEDFNQNAGILRTLLCLKQWLGGNGKGAYLSMMLGFEKLYKKKLIRLEAKEKKA